MGPPVTLNAECDIVLVWWDDWGQDHWEAEGRPGPALALLPEFDVALYRDALRESVSGVVDGSLPAPIIEHVAQAALTGEVVLPLEVARRLLPDRPVDHDVELTDEEADVLRGYAAGETTSQLAERLFLSERSVRRRLQNASVKLGATTRQQAVGEAIRRGIID